MRCTIASGLVSAALLAGAARAQEAEKKAVSAGAEAVQKPEAKLEALVARYNKNRDDMYQLYTSATTDEEREKAIRGMDGTELLPEFRALALESKGTDVAARAWLWVMKLTDGDSKAAWEIVQLLLEEHMTSPALEELTGELRYATHQHGEHRVREALRAIVDETPHQRVRARALFTLGAVLVESASGSSKTQGRDCFNAVIAEYGKLEYQGSTYAQAAEAFLYELDHLQIGMAAPDFETVDENGAKWRLSDYKGKVVVVDFWGYW